MVKSIQDLIPRSRINLRYRTMIDGELKEVELPFRIMVLADLSFGSSVDREVDLESRRLRTLDGKNLDDVMENMRMSISFEAKNCIEADEETLPVTLPIKKRASFNPAEVAASVPKIRSLLLLRKLLLEMQSNIDNRKDLRKLIQELFSKPEELQKVQNELAAMATYQLPTRRSLAQSAPAADQSATP